MSASFPALLSEPADAPSSELAEFVRALPAAPASIFVSSGKAMAAKAPYDKASLPLSGKIFAVKDNIDVAGYPTTAACPGFERVPEKSATVVQRLIEAGASVAGKTNLDQFACGLVGTRSPYGAVPNAFNPLYVSGGSSSGSAVAVALGLVDFALGTDTAGSGRVPAGFNNIVGLKPTRGLLSTAGILPACAHIDCPSIFARTVDDAVDVLMAAATYDPQDPYSRPVKLDTRAFPAVFRFGVPDDVHLNFFGDVQAEQAFAQACARLEKLGGTKVKIDYTPLASAASALYEDAWVAERYAAIREFFDSHPERIYPVVHTIISAGKRYSAADLFDAMTRMRAYGQKANAMWTDIDVLVVPTAPTIYTIEEVDVNPIELNRRLGTYTNAVNLLDMAALAVPSAIREDGLPFGITFIGPAASDLRLADIGARYHAATGLTLGISEEPVPPAKPLARPAGSTVSVAVVGAHLSGMPLNYQLLERGARLTATVTTSRSYRLYALAGANAGKPGLVRTSANEGAAIALEIWEMPIEHYGSFVAAIPQPLGIGSITLADGGTVQGFLCESEGLRGATEITAYGGWKAYVNSSTNAK